MEYKTGDILHGFELRRIREISDCGGVLYEMRHRKTGMELCWMKRNEKNKTFSITFKTIPEDDTGVFHMLEHSVLNGSRKYPVREPFVELLKSSMQTFLNAFTYPDKTMYPVSSKNEKDFMNLMSVYVDAVFHPMIYTNPNIFYQEGWHYEIRNREDDPVFKGVVLNEMKGSFANMDETLIDEFDRVLFPDNCYRFVSGGDPEHITDLTYEQFLDTHRKYYHPSNAKVFLDGDMDIHAVLTFLNGEISEYEREDVSSIVIEKQERRSGTVSRVLHEVTPEEGTEGRAMIGLGKIVTSFDDPMKIMAWGVLSSILTSSNDAPLKKAILDQGLAEDVDLDMMDGIQQPWAAIVLRNTDEDKYDVIRKTLRETAEKLVRDGLDHEQILAALNSFEFRYREKHEPSGLIYVQRAMEAWLYGGDPAQNLMLSDKFDLLRNKAEEGYFEELLREFLLEEDTLSAVIVIPSATLGEEKAAAERKKLQDAKQSWGDEIDTYIEKNLALDRWQEEEDSEETLATLPMLELKDVSEEPEFYPWQEDTFHGVPVLRYPEESSGIVYLNLYFNLAGVKMNDLPALAFWSDLMLSLPTAKHTLEELNKEIRMNLGTLGIYLDSFTPSRDRNSCIPVLCVSCSVLKKNTQKAAEIILEVLRETIFDKEKILPLLKQDNEGFRQTLISSGHAVAARRAAASASSEAAFREAVGGYTGALYTKKLENEWDTMADAFLEECAMYQEVLFSPARLTASVSGSHDDMLETIISGLNDISAERAVVHYPIPEDRKEYVVIPGGVSYTGVVSNIKKHDGQYNTGMLVMSHILTYEYLWSEVRVKGGAYGTGFSVNSNGTFMAYSYRDPDPQNALRAFVSTADFIEGISDEDELDSLIIGAIASTEQLSSPASRIKSSDAIWFRRLGYEDLKAMRVNCLSLKPADLRSFAPVLRTAMNNASVCAAVPKEKADEFKAMGYEELPKLI